MTPTLSYLWRIHNTIFNKFHYIAQDLQNVSHNYNLVLACLLDNELFLKTIFWFARVSWIMNILINHRIISYKLHETAERKRKEEEEK